MQALSSAVQSGDMTSAQQALTQLQQDSPLVAQALQSGDSSSDSPQVSALKSLASAVQSGDASAAQSALSQLQQSGPGGSSGVHGHHHHHHHAAPTDPATTDNTTSSTNDSSAGSLINVSV